MSTLFARPTQGPAAFSDCGRPRNTLLAHSRKQRLRSPRRGDVPVEFGEDDARDDHDDGRRCPLDVIHELLQDIEVPQEDVGVEHQVRHVLRGVRALCTAQS